jgi:hypothetical protein
MGKGGSGSTATVGLEAVALERDICNHRVGTAQTSQRYQRNSEQYLRGSGFNHASLDLICDKKSTVIHDDSGWAYWSWTRKISRLEKDIVGI